MLDAAASFAIGSPIVRRGLVMLVALASPACALDFDHFVDGSVSSTADAGSYDASGDADPAGSCAYPWLMLGVSGPVHSTIQRYSFHADGTLDRCADFAGLPARLDRFAAIDPFRVAIESPLGITIVDIRTGVVRNEPRPSGTDLTPASAFVVFSQTRGRVGVSYRRSTGSIGVVRFVPIDEPGTASSDWRPNVDQPPLDALVSAVALHPSSPGHVVVALDAAHGPADVLLFGGTVGAALFRDSTGDEPFSANGVWHAGVGFGVGGNASPSLAVATASDHSAMPDLMAHDACAAQCENAERFDVFPDPLASSTTPAAYAFCKRASGDAAVLRWSVGNPNECTAVISISAADAALVRSMDILPSATR